MINVDLTNYYSGLEVDKTIAVFRGSLVLPAGGSNQVDHVLPIGAGHTFWEGTYILDGFSQQNDIGGMQYSGLRGAGLEARSFVGGIRVRGVNTTGSSVTATYNLSVIASPETGIIPAQGTFPALDNPIAFDSRDDHRKIVITRAFRAGDGFDFTSNWQKIVFRGDEDILAQTKRVKVFIVLDNGYMFDSSTHYGRSQITIAGGEVIACLPFGVLDSASASTDAYIRYFYE